MAPDGAVHFHVRGQDSVGFSHQRGPDRVSVATGERVRDGQHPFHSPEQVDRGRPGCGQQPSGSMKTGLHLVGRSSQRFKGDPERGRDPDGGSAPDHHIADAVGHAGGIVVFEPLLGPRKQALIQHEKCVRFQIERSDVHSAHPRRATPAV